MATQQLARLTLADYELRFLNTVPARQIYQLRHNQAVAALTGRQVDHDLAATARFIYQTFAAAQNGDYFTWGIMDREDDTFYGLVQLWHFRQRVADVGYEISPQWQHYGVMHAILPAIAKLAFTQLDVKCLYAVTGAANYPSRRLLETSGFQLDRHYHETLMTKQQAALLVVRYWLAAA